MTASRFAWECLGSPPWEPPEPKRGQPRYGPDDICWLCGGPTEGIGWPWRTAISATFTNHTLAAAPWSQTVCQPCAYMGSGDAWRQYCATRPEKGWKSVHPLSWRSYSHVFRPGYHDCPRRNEWRAILLEPPEPPFMVVIAESGQKHIVYRAMVGYDRESYPLQLEESLVYVRRELLAECIDDFEALLALGLTRDEIASGRYSQGRLGKLDINLWHVLDRGMSRWRRSAPDYVRLAHIAAHGPAREER